jgi:hypothetical protein
MATNRCYTQGFSLYLTLAAKNYFYEGKTESRWLDLTIVCNVMFSSGPPDLAGVFRRMSGESDALEKAAQTYDATNLNRVPVSATTGVKGKKKGDKPQDKDQKKWAPLHYFVPAVAGSLVAMTNKLGSWNMGLSPGFKLVSDFLFAIVNTRLPCLISEYDDNNASRYANPQYPLVFSPANLTFARFGTFVVFNLYVDATLVCGTKTSLIKDCHPHSY